MRASQQGFQATDLSPLPGGSAVPVAETPARGRAAGRGAIERVGVVFVHGIGTQGPAETFLDWSSAIVEILKAWRVERELPVDPVVRAQFAFSPSALPFLELDIPAYAGRDASRWIVTEALWAEAVRAPGLDAVSRYLRDRLFEIVSGIRAGYKEREPPWKLRRDRTVAQAGPPGDPEVDARIVELHPRWWRWIDTLDSLQRSVLTQWLVVFPLIALGTVALVVWAPLRRLPIGPLRDFAEAKLVDSFLTNWFGDLPVLLDDPVQAANVRARVAETVAALHAQGCDSVVMVAHSGGAIVAFETLLDPEYLPTSDHPIHVAKLITIGEGLKLGWRLEGAETKPLRRGDRLTGDLGKARPELRWVDVWASFDPAPAGPLPATPPAGVSLRVAETGEPGEPGGAAGGVLVVESRPVTNLMSLLNDHGSYWDNDEGYLVPLLRHIDDPHGSGDGSRFYREPRLRTVRIERRRQRVAVLGAWRWLVAVAAAGAIVGGGLTAGAPRLAGNTAIAIWQRVPGGELLSGPVAAIWGAIGAILSLFGGNALADGLPSIGPVIVGIVVIALVFGGLGRVGRSVWSRWDVRERDAARRERLPPLDRRYAAAGFVTGVAALVTFVFAALNAGTGARVGLILGTGLLLGLAISALVVALLPTPDAPATTAATEVSAAPSKAVTPRPARGTPRTPRAAPRTSRPASRRPRRSG